MPILAAGLLAYALLLWPGGIYTDTIGLIQQGQTGIYDDWHSPSLAVVLAIFGTIRTGSGMLLLLGAGLLACGIYLILRRMGLSAIAAACSSVLIIFSPPVLAANFWLSKDTPALGSLLIGSALILSPRRPEAVTGGGFLLFACLVRLDYGVLSALAVGYAACMARSGLPPLSRTVRFCKASIIFFVACIAVQTGIHTALRVKSQAPVQASLLHDLAAISVATGDHRAPAFMLDQGWSREFVASHFDPYSHDPLKWPGDHPPSPIQRTPPIISIPFACGRARFQAILWSTFIIGRG